MKNIRKYFLPFLLGLVMIISALSRPARAEDGKTAETDNAVSEQQAEETPPDTAAPEKTTAEAPDEICSVTASGDGYAVTVTFTAAAGLPAGTYLTAEEILPGGADYAECFDAALLEGEDVFIEPDALRAFDLTLHAPDGTPVQPEASVSVAISLSRPMAEAEHENRVFHLSGGKSEEIRTEGSSGKKRGGETVAFTAGSFSAYVVAAYLDGSSLNAIVSGQAYSIGRLTSANNVYVMQNDALEGNKLSLVAGSYEKRSTKTYWTPWAEYSSAAPDAWTFTKISSGKYTIRNANGQYLNMAADGLTLSDTSQTLLVSAAGSSNGFRIRADGTNDYLSVDRTNKYFTVQNTAKPGVDQGFRLLTFEESTQNAPVYIAEKYNSYDMQGAQGSYEAGMTVDDIIIYTRIFNEEANRYDYYVIDGSGNAVYAYDDGDVIKLHSVVSPVWHMTICTRNQQSDGQPNGYYIIQNVGTELVLDPQEGTLVGPFDSYTTSGVRLDGREAHESNSTMEKWDSGANRNYGYALVQTDDGIKLQSVPEGQSVAFSFARVVHPAAGELHPVDTVDSVSRGITIRMFDYGGGIAEQAASATTQAGTGTWIDDYAGAFTFSGDERPTKGIVTRTLGADGFPVFTKTNLSAGNLFDPTQAGTHDFYRGEANKLFIRNVYDSTGYYSYSGFQNFAHYNSDGTFTVYQEIGTAGGRSNATTLNPTHTRGHFLPYNTISADRPAVYGHTNQYDANLAPLDYEDPNLGETLYQAGTGQPNWAHPGTEPVDYYFGMSVDFDFMQTKGGLMDGNPLIYEFIGDDDLWIYVDGVLLLDLGGVHSAANGSIDFANGEIAGDGVTSEDNTIAKCFRLANVFPDGTAWDESKAGKYFVYDEAKGEYTTFRDYTSHSFKMLYLEHGASASNLVMRFNLAVVEENQFVVEKELAGTVQGDYANVPFAYQAFYYAEEDTALTNPIPLVPGVTFAGHSDTVEVVYEGTEDAVSFHDGEVIEGVSYDNVFYLKPGEAAVFRNIPENVNYFVQEVGLPDGFYDSVSVNGAAVAQQNGVYPCIVDTVGDRPRAVFTNDVSDENSNSLLIHKVLDDGSEDDGTTFMFQILMENTAGGLAEYSKAPYYIKKGDTYYVFSGGVLVPYSGTGLPEPYLTSAYGLVENIPLGFTVEIPQLPVGTSFYVAEVQIPENWSLKSKLLLDGSYDGSDLAGQAWDYETNDYAPVTADGQIKYDTDAEVTFTNMMSIDIPVIKVWASPAGFQPESVTVKLYKQIGSGEKQQVGEAVTLSADNTPAAWGYTWTGLAKFAKDGENRVAVTYSVEEDPVPVGYTAVVENTAAEGFSFKITNTPHETEITVEKVWDDDDDRDGKRPTSIQVQLYQKIGSAAETAYGQPVTLSAGADGVWSDTERTYKWEHLPAVQGENDVSYRVDELSVPAYYTKTVTGSGTAYTVTNSYSPETVDVEVRKVWASAVSFQPESITVELLANGVSFDPAKTAVLSEENGWTCSWTGLPKYARNGDTVELITYTAKEDPEPASYEVSYSPEDGNTGIVITVTNTPQTVDVPVEKVWKDNDNAYGVRPESITVKLYKQFGEGEKTLVDTQTLNADNSWKYTWTGLPQYGLNGSVKSPYTYTVEEEGVAPGYAVEVSGNMTDGYTITNTFKPVDTDPPVAKVVKGDTPDKDETFTFKLAAVETNVEGMTPATMPLPEGAENGVMTMTIVGTGMKEFGQFFFTKPGYYKYEIYEVNDGKKDYTYDTHVYTVEYTITVNKEDNSLVKEMKVDLVVVKEFAADQFKFVNTYEKEIPPPPFTGDDSHIAVNAVMMGLSMAGIFFVTKKKKEEDAETE